MERERCGCCKWGCKGLQELIAHLNGYIDASEEVVLIARPSRLGYLLEKPSQAFDTAHLVQFTDGIQHRVLVVVIPADQTQLSTGSFKSLT